MNAPFSEHLSEAIEMFKLKQGIKVVADIIHYAGQDIEIIIMNISDKECTVLINEAKHTEVPIELIDHFIITELTVL